MFSPFAQKLRYKINYKLYCLINKATAICFIVYSQRIQFIQVLSSDWVMTKHEGVSPVYIINTFHNTERIDQVNPFPLKLQERSPKHRSQRWYGKWLRYGTNSAAQRWILSICCESRFQVRYNTEEQYYIAGSIIVLYSVVKIGG